MIHLCYKTAISGGMRLYSQLLKYFVSYLAWRGMGFVSASDYDKDKNILPIFNNYFPVLLESLLPPYIADWQL